MLAAIYLKTDKTVTTIYIAVSCLQDSSRKYRLKFLASAGSSSLDICNNVVKVLRQYINVLDVTPGKTQPQTGGSQAAMDISTFHPDDILMGEVTQSQLIQVLTAFKPKFVHAVCSKMHNLWIC